MAHRRKKQKTGGGAGAGAGAGAGTGGGAHAGVNPAHVKIFNDLVTKRKVGPGQATWNSTRDQRLAELARDIVQTHARDARAFPDMAKKLERSLLFPTKEKRDAQKPKVAGVGSIMSNFTKRVFAAVRDGALPASAIGFHVVSLDITDESSVAALEEACAPMNGDQPRDGWVSNSHGQQRLVWTHGLTLLDRERLIAAPCKTQPFPTSVKDNLLGPITQAVKEKLGVDAKFDFLYVNKYRKSAKSFIRYHHDHLTQMGPVVVGVSFGAPATLSLAATCLRDGKTAGALGTIDIKLPPRSMYIMSGLSRYAYKHGVIDASANGDRVSLTFRKVERECVTKSGDWTREPSALTGKKIQHTVGYVAEKAAADDA